MSNARDMGIAVVFAAVAGMEKSATPTSVGPTGSASYTGLSSQASPFASPAAAPSAAALVRDGRSHYQEAAGLPLSALPASLQAGSPLGDPVTPRIPAATPKAAPSFMQGLAGYWSGMPEAQKANIMKMLLIGGVGGGLIGLLRSRMKPEGQRPGMLGTVGSMIGHGLVAGGGAALGAHLWGKYGPAFGSSNTPAPAAAGKPGAPAPAVKPAAPMPAAVAK